MADAIDTKVVKMKFDNEEFHKKTEGTLSILEKLKEGLKFDGASKGLNDVAVASKTFSLNHVGEAVDAIASKFSALGAIGFTVLNTLTNQAITAGERMAKALSIEGIGSGFKEYESNIGAIQTILANTESKGSTLTDVNLALEELNKYADQTIYSFGDMTKGIGQFTAAGVGLKESVADVKGLSNLMALSGSSAEKAAPAFYQLSQAIASGTVRAQDWESVNAAGISGQVFQKSLFETARALGTLVDVPVGQTFEDWSKAGGNIRDLMAEGAITGKVMSLSLQGFSGDLDKASLISSGYSEMQAEAIMKTANTASAAATNVKTFTQLIGTLKEAVGSGWSESFKYIFGNFEQAKELFSSLYQVFGGIISGSAGVRNNILKDWMTLGGRTSLIQSLRNVLWSLASVFMVVQKAFRDAFPRKSGLELAIISEQIQEFTKKLIPAQDTLERLGRIFGGLFSILAIGWTIIKTVIGVFFDLFGAISHVAGAGGGTLELFAKLGDAITWLKKVLVDDGGIKKVFSDWLTPIFDFVRNIDIVGPIKSAIEKLQELKDAIVRIYDDNIAPKLKPIIDALSNFKNMIADLFSKFQKPDGFDGLSDATGRLSDRWKTLTEVGEFLGKVFGWVGEQVQKGVEWFKGFIPGIADSFKSGDFSLLQDALNIGIFAAMYSIIKKFLDNGVLGTLLGGGVMDEFKKTLVGIQNELRADALLKIAEAMVLLTASLLVLSLIDPVRLALALFATGAGFAQLAGQLVIIEKTVKGGRQTAATLGAATAMVIIAGAILVLALAVKFFSMMDPEELKQGIAGVVIVMGAMALSIRAMGDPENALKAAAAILALSVAVAKLIKAIQEFGTMDMEVIKQGLFGVSTSILLIVAAIRLVPQDAEQKGLGIGFLTLALMGLAKVVTMFGEMDFDVLAQGLFAFAGVLAIVTLSMASMGDDRKRFIETAAGIGIISIAMIIMARSIQELGAAEHLLSAVLAFAAMMLVIVLAVRALNGKEAIEGALTIAVIAASVMILTLALKALSEIGVLNVLALLFGIVVFLGILAIGALLLTSSGATEALAAFALAVWTLGLGIALTGLGVLLFAGAIYVVVLAIKELASIGEEALTFIPKVMKSLSEGAIEGIKSFLGAVPQMLVLFGGIISSIVTLIKEKVPEIVEAMGAILHGFIDWMYMNFQGLVELGWFILSSILHGIADHIFDIATTVGTIITELLSALTLKMPEMTAKGIEFLVAWLGGLTMNTAVLVGAISLFLLNLMLEIDRKIPAFVEMGSKMAIDFINAMGAKADDLAKAVSGFIVQLMRALAAATVAIADEAIKVATSLLDGIANAIDNGGEKLDESIKHFVKSIIKGLANGFKSGAGGVKEAIEELSAGMLYKLTHPWETDSPSRVTTRLGDNIAAGLAVGFNTNTSAVAGAETLASDVMSGLKDTLSSTIVNPEIMWNDSPTITPVLDLTGVKKTAGEMNTLWDSPTIDPTVSTLQAASMAVVAQEQAANTATDPAIATDKAPQPIHFTQINNAPHELSTSDIYRNTRSQIALAKEELNV